MAGDDESNAVLKYYLECMHHEGLGQVPAFFYDAWLCRMF